MFKFVRAASPMLPAILPDENGRPTSDPVKQLKAAQKAWSPYLQRYSDVPIEPDDFIKEYACEIDQLKVDMPDQLIDRDKFFQAIKQRRKEAAGGADSWKTRELQR